MRNYVGEFMGQGVVPRDVFLAGTTAQRGNLMNALVELNIPVLLCAAHRLRSGVGWALGVNGSKATGRNPSARDVTARAASLAGALSHSAFYNNANDSDDGDVDDARLDHHRLLLLLRDDETMGDDEAQQARERRWEWRKASGALAGMAEEHRDEFAMLEGLRGGGAVFEDDDPNNFGSTPPRNAPQ